jgi:hypothetical protein
VLRAQVLCVLSIVYPARNVDRLVNVPSKKNQARLRLPPPPAQIFPSHYPPPPPTPPRRPLAPVTRCTATVYTVCHTGIRGQGLWLGLQESPPHHPTPPPSQAPTSTAASSSPRPSHRDAVVLGFALQY